MRNSATSLRAATGGNWGARPRRAGSKLSTIFVFRGKKKVGGARGPKLTFFSILQSIERSRRAESDGANLFEKFAKLTF
jgi:hypothetical protein